MSIARYAKAGVAVVSAGLLVVQTVITMPANAHGWVTVVIAVLAAAGVYAVPNAPARPPDLRGLSTGPSPSTKPPPGPTIAGGGTQYTKGV